MTAPEHSEPTKAPSVPAAPPAGVPSAPGDAAPDTTPTDASEVEAPAVGAAEPSAGAPAAAAPAAPAPAAPAPAPAAPAAPAAASVPGAGSAQEPASTPSPEASAAGRPGAAAGEPASPAPAPSVPDAERSAVAPPVAAPPVVPPAASAAGAPADGAPARAVPAAAAVPPVEPVRSAGASRPDAERAAGISDAERAAGTSDASAASQPVAERPSATDGKPAATPEAERATGTPTAPAASQPAAAHPSAAQGAPATPGASDTTRPSAASPSSGPAAQPAASAQPAGPAQPAASTQPAAPGQPVAQARPGAADAAATPARDTAAKPAAPSSAAPAAGAATNATTPAASKPTAASKPGAAPKPDAAATPGAAATSDAQAEPATPVEDADQVAVLQTVVAELATPPTKAAKPRSGYTPRVFAFDRPPKTGAGAAPAGAAAAGTAAAAAGAAGAATAGTPPTAPDTTADTTTSTEPAPAPPSVPPFAPRPGAAASDPGAVPTAEAGQIPFLKPLTGAIQRVARPWAPVRPEATPLATSAPQGPGGPGAPGGPHGPAGPNGPGAAGQDGFFGLAGDGAPSRGPKIALLSVLGAVVLFAIYAFAAWGVSDTVPKDTTVAGVNVGGMTQTEAAAALTEQLGPRLKEPIDLTAGEGKAQLSPEPSGLAIDAEATTAELTGFSLSPARMWAHMFGGAEQELVLAVDSEKFDAAVAGLEESLAVEPVDGTVAFVDGQAVKTDAKDGSRIVASETSRIIKARWLHQDGPFDLPVEPVAPVITQAQTDKQFAVAQKIVSAPVTVSVGGQRPQLSPQVLSGLIRFEQKDDQLVTIVDREATVEAIVNATTNLLEVPSDAHFEFAGGKPTVVAGKTGTTLDPAEAGKAVRIAATGDDRETSVELVEQDPKDTVESLEALGVKEVVSEFSTPLTDEPVRTQNLMRGADMVTGNLIKPGETFSLLEALAPITLENGYFDAGVVENGEHVEAVGGGLSQMATTSFNAGFFAGFEDVEHHAHSYWFPRYPAGREATIYVGAKDMKFTNDTPYGAVMQAYVSGGRLTVRIWSTKYYTVQENTSAKRNIVPKTTIHDSSADCQPYPGGEDGFSVTISRKVLHDGKVVKENSFNHSYNPDNPVVCD
ncbi:VanW family protein [Promicromonospora sp. NPDC019610]|uniref:VanW family protein n=1 Tax=Promicromonospora sp. NPDC019610 TaxID=3364405 RepID=UPI0037B0ED17